MRLVASLVFVVACGSAAVVSPKTPDAAVDDASTSDETPVLPDPCAHETIDIPGGVTECAESPCSGRDLGNGVSCSGLPLGFLCEEGTHPDFRCNRLARCNAGGVWETFQSESRIGACDRKIVRGTACANREACNLGPSDGCLDGDRVCATTCRDVGFTRPRLHCPCTTAPTAAFVCKDGTLEIAPTPPPPG